MTYEAKKQGFIKEPLLGRTKEFFENLASIHHELVYPELLAQRHPHILNNLMEVWKSPLRTQDYFSKLLLSEGDRQGFKEDVFKELMNLQFAYDKLHPMYQDKWSEHKYKR